MARVVVTDVQVMNNPCKFGDNFKFQITFDCIAPGLTGELEWKLVYVGSADDKAHDQLLDSVLVGPVEVGKNSFVFEAPAPDYKLIPPKDLLEVTVVLLTCSYMDREFVRVGYYVNNYFATPELQANPPIHSQRNINTIYRNLAHDQPRVTRLNIPWDAVAAAAAGSNGAGGGGNEFQMSSADAQQAAQAEDMHPNLLQDDDKDDTGMDDYEDEEGGNEANFASVDNSHLLQHQRQPPPQQGGMDIDMGMSVDAFKDSIDLSIR